MSAQTDNEIVGRTGVRKSNVKLLPVTSVTSPADSKTAGKALSLEPSLASSKFPVPVKYGAMKQKTYGATRYSTSVNLGQDSVSSQQELLKLDVIDSPYSVKDGTTVATSSSKTANNYDDNKKGSQRNSDMQKLKERNVTQINKEVSVKNVNSNQTSKNDTMNDNLASLDKNELHMNMDERLISLKDIPLNSSVTDHKDVQTQLRKVHDDERQVEENSIPKYSNKNEKDSHKLKSNKKDTIPTLQDVRGDILETSLNDETENIVYHDDDNNNRAVEVNDNSSRRNSSLNDKNKLSNANEKETNVKILGSKVPNTNAAIQNQKIELSITTARKTRKTENNNLSLQNKLHVVDEMLELELSKEMDKENNVNLMDSKSRPSLRSTLDRQNKASDIADSYNVDNDIVQPEPQRRLQKENEKVKMFKPERRNEDSTRLRNQKRNRQEGYQMEKELGDNENEIENDRRGYKQEDLLVSKKTAKRTFGTELDNNLNIKNIISSSNKPSNANAKDTNKVLNTILESSKKKVKDNMDDNNNRNNWKIASKRKSDTLVRNTSPDDEIITSPEDELPKKKKSLYNPLETNYKLSPRETRSRRRYTTSDPLLRSTSTSASEVSSLTQDVENTIPTSKKYHNEKNKKRRTMPLKPLLEDDDGPEAYDNEDDVDEDSNIMNQLITYLNNIHTPMIL